MPTCLLSEGTEFPSVYELSTLDGWNGFVINGVTSGDNSGWSVSSAGDVNGDGIDDILIGAPLASPGGRVQAGTSYVVFGKSDIGNNGTFELKNLDDITGFILPGPGAMLSDFSGASVSGAGDVNGDGIADFLIGAPGIYQGGFNGVGVSFIVFGNVDIGRNGTLELSSLNGTKGFLLYGNDAGSSGTSVSGVGDVNGDGIVDFLIGAPIGDGPDQSGRSYLVFGNTNLGKNGNLLLSSMNGTIGFVLNGVKNDHSGKSVSGGDINGDGIADILIGAPGASPNEQSSAGRTYVIFGKSDIGESGILELSSLNGTIGFAFNGANPGDGSIAYSGSSVSYAGDLNGDGIGDILIAAPGGRPYTNRATYVVFGRLNFDNNGTVELASLNGTTGFLLSGIRDNGGGISVSGVGDVNGDGVNDLLIGESSPGRSYVVFGQRGERNTASVEFSGLNGTSGFALNGASDEGSSGTSVSGAGDVNGDGVADLLIGTPTNNGGTSAGRSYIVFGDIPPILISNYLQINQRETYVLTSANLNATHFAQDPDKLIFHIGYLSQGQFELVDNPNVPITNFTQGQIRQSQIQFVHSGEQIPPSYQVAVSSGRFIISTPQFATIQFNVAPVLINNTLDITARYQQLVLSTAELYAADPYHVASQLLFTIDGLQNGQFCWMRNGNATLSFNLQNVINSEVAFNATDKQPVYFVSVTNGRLTTSFQEANVDFTAPPLPVPETSENNTVNTVVGVLAGTAGVVALGLATYGYFRSKARDKLSQAVETTVNGQQQQSVSRKQILFPFVKVIYEHIKVSGFLGHLDESTAHSFVGAIDTLVDELQKQGVNLDLEKMTLENQQQLLHEVVKQIRLQTIPQARLCSPAVACRFFKAEMIPVQIEDKVRVIAAAVQASFGKVSDDRSEFYTQTNRR